MNSKDLFSFLDQAPEESDTDGEIAPAEVQSDLPRKRKTIDEQTADISSNGIHPTEENEPGPSKPKKERRASPSAPLVVDEVEIEAKREVAASAGLQGAVEAGARLELRHQVRTILSIVLCRS